MVLNKIFGNKNSNNNLSNMYPLSHESRAPPATSGPIERKSRALKIVHVGGHAERYYMAIPASTIIEKYPSFILARPEVFRRPWDSIVHPDEILVPGQKYYVVPRQTVRKLRRRIIKKESSLSLVENASSHDHNKDSLSTSGILIKPGLMKIKARNLHVRFFGIDTTNDQKQGSGLAHVSCDDKNSNGEKGLKERLKNPHYQMDQKKRSSRYHSAWEPSFDAINE